MATGSGGESGRGGSGRRRRQRGRRRADQQGGKTASDGAKQPTSSSDKAGRKPARPASRSVNPSRKPGQKPKDSRPPKKDASFGVVPVYVDKGVRQYLLIQHLGGHWGFPKGHPEKGESPEESARRELFEETGLDCELIEGPVMVESYAFRQRGGRRVQKTVTYFIGYVASQNVTLQEDEVIGAFWGDAEQTREQLTFEEGRRLLALAEAHLKARDAEGDDADT